MPADQIPITLYNSLSRKKEVFRPINPPKVGMYTCGPTIYGFAHIGNWRTYLVSDLLYRTLIFNKYDVLHVMNLTDVGHLSGDNLGDSSQGEDRIMIASKKEGIDAWAISEKYGKDFISSMGAFNIIRPKIIPKATEHIKEQIELIKKIEEKGFTYKTSDGIYFDIKKYEEAGNSYGELSNIDPKSTDSRIEPNPEKKDQRDFALWKFFATGQKRHGMEWDSPWGVGFPGWHIECSAMSMKYLGDRFDIHVGGEDLQSTHHPNEIAQSEGATGKKPFVKYWVHVTFLLVDGGKMGKSLGNAYTLHDIVKKGYDPLAFRYLVLGTHYKKSLNFTWENLESAQTALYRLRREAPSVSEHEFDDDERLKISSDPYYIEFLKAINDDLNSAKALAIVWKVLESNVPNKALLLSEFDEVLGLDIYSEGKWDVKNKGIIPTKDLPKDIRDIVLERQKARKNKEFGKADELRSQLEELGYIIEDHTDGVVIRKV